MLEIVIVIVTALFPPPLFLLGIALHTRFSRASHLVSDFNNLLFF